MKKITNFIFTAFTSLIISLLLFFMVSLYLFIPNKSNHITAQKNETGIPYFYSDKIKSVTFLISIENCPVDFFIDASSEHESLKVTHTAKNIAAAKKYQKQIYFDIEGLENFVNYLGGIEIETPYGLPSPAKNKKIIAKNEKLLVYGVSLGEILTDESSPSDQRIAYYCYIIKELCFKFLSECTIDSYKFLKQNCKTDISYADFYDHYEAFKDIIKR